MTTHPLEIPAFLKRSKDNKVPKVKMKGITLAKATPTPKTSPLDSLSSEARALAEAEIAASRARLHWFEDQATCAYYEALAIAPKKGALDDDTRADLRRMKELKRAAKPSKEGLVSIATIAKDLKIIPRVARAALRGLKVTKPTIGWNFATTEVNTIKEKITSWLQQSKTSSADTIKSKRKSSKTPRVSSTSSTPATPKKTSGKRVAPSTGNAKRSSEKHAKASGSSKRAAKTATASGTKTRGTKSGTRRSSSTSKTKRK